jgi:hypothetical protein
VIRYLVESDLPFMLPYPPHERLIYLKHYKNCFLNKEHFRNPELFEQLQLEITKAEREQQQKE